MKEPNKTLAAIVGFIFVVSLIVFIGLSAGAALDKEHDAHQAKMHNHQTKYQQR